MLRRGHLLHGPDDRLTHGFLMDQEHPQRATIQDAWHALLSRAGSGRELWVTPAELARRTPGLRGEALADAVLRAFAMISA